MRNPLALIFATKCFKCERTIWFPRHDDYMTLKGSLDSKAGRKTYFEKRKPICQDCQASLFGFDQK